MINDKNTLCFLIYWWLIGLAVASILKYHSGLDSLWVGLELSVHVPHLSTPGGGSALLHVFHPSVGHFHHNRFTWLSVRFPAQFKMWDKMKERRQWSMCGDKHVAPHIIIFRVLSPDVQRGAPLQDHRPDRPVLSFHHELHIRAQSTFKRVSMKKSQWAWSVEQLRNPETQQGANGVEGAHQRHKVSQSVSSLNEPTNQTAALGSCARTHGVCELQSLKLEVTTYAHTPVKHHGCWWWCWDTSWNDARRLSPS